MKVKDISYISGWDCRESLFISFYLRELCTSSLPGQLNGQVIEY